MIKVFSTKRIHPLVIVIFSFFILLSIYFQLKSIALVPFIADEPDDLSILLHDLHLYPNLFSATAISPDQSRLPHLLALPLAWLFQDNLNQAIIAIRGLFFTFYLGYLFISFRLVLLITGMQTAAWFYVLLLTASSYLSAFAVFSMTTSDSLFMLFHIAVLYSFYRSWITESSSGIFPNTIGLALLLGLCFASKLFGLFIAISIFIFHILYHRNQRTTRVYVPSPIQLLVLGGLFLFLLLVINLAPVGAGIKLTAAVILSGFYLAYIIFNLVKEIRKKSDPRNINIFLFWIVIAITAFNLMLIFSPVYLNMQNLAGILEWPEKWNQGLIVAGSRWWDISMIMLVKYGLISFAALLVPVVIYAYRHRNLVPSAIVLLIVLVFIVHFIIISLVKHKVTWYPLAIFPFLYLPIVWLWVHAIQVQSKKLLIVAMAVFVVTIADNVYRYAYWFPYAHFDGAQYGRAHIGWNKSALVTYEVLPLLEKFFSRIRVKDNSKQLTVNIAVTRVPQYNRWMNEMLSSMYASTYPYIRFESIPNITDPRYEILLSSPIYNRELEQELRSRGYKRNVKLAVKGIPVITAWFMNSTKSAE
ncbi:MAG TPA: hypothetical protein ENH39_08390 [Gammaproteobacteria bacterium]|nr:hypothetical protein [Gammaproteobacteria bacterium]